MELVYLWVEDYKNIDHQGFNFSLGLLKKYDEDLTELAFNNKMSSGGFSAVFFFKCINIHG